MRRLRIRVVALAALAAALSLCHCAKFPSGGGGETGKRLIFSVTFAAPLHVSPDNAYYYFVLINNANDPQGVTGPVPVIQFPWGNGYAAGAYTHFVTVGRFNLGATDQCNLWQIQGGNLDAPIPRGLTRVSNVHDNIMSFEINSADLGIDLSTAGPVIPLQINIIATDQVPVSGDTAPHKHWDALGNGFIQQYTAYITIDIGQNTTHTRADYGGESFEPTGDVGGGEPGDTKDPALDITDFSITVRS